MEPDDSLLDWPAVHSRVEHGSGLDRTGSDCNFFENWRIRTGSDWENFSYFDV